jgi:hypothetical protein
MAEKEYDYDENVSGNDLFWPTNLVGKYDHLKMQVTKFVPISSVTPTNSLANSESTTATPVSAGSTTNISASSSLSNIQSFGKQRLAEILLPIPEKINYADALNWSEDNLGILGKMAPGLAKSAGSGNLDQVAGQLQTLAEGGLSEFVLNKLTSAIGITAEALTQGVGGRILNPYKEQIFKGVSMRNFDFNWKLVPRNATEQGRIHRIIKALRYYSLPNYSADSGFNSDESSPSSQNLSDRWLTVPNIFNLSWHYGQNSNITSLPKLKPCVLKNVTVDYTPDGVWATHINTASAGISGPAPIAYTINLQFSETEIITAKSVAVDGF